MVADIFTQPPYLKKASYGLDLLNFLNYIYFFLMLHIFLYKRNVFKKVKTFLEACSF